MEIWKTGIWNLSFGKELMRNNITEYMMKDGKVINVIGEGRLVNLAAGDGHPAEIMDMSFALQAFCVKYINDNYENLDKKVYDVPEKIDNKVAYMKLKGIGIEIDKLSAEQEQYLKGWGE